MTVSELFDYMDKDETFKELSNKALNISMAHMEESMEVMDKLIERFKVKYQDVEDEALASESDVDDLKITSQAIMNSICMYLGAVALYYEGDADKVVSVTGELIERLKIPR